VLCLMISFFRFMFFFCSEIADELFSFFIHVDSPKIPFSIACVNEFISEKLINKLLMPSGKEAFIFHLEADVDRRERNCIFIAQCRDLLRHLNVHNEIRRLARGDKFLFKLQ
jgi:hypothetical protein